MSQLRIKVCGMRDPKNLQQLIELGPDYVGFIFYRPSARYVGDEFAESIPEMVIDAKRVGVFVNAPFDEIVSKANRYNLHLAQLHGDETPELCQKLRESGLEIIKAFRVDESFSFDETRLFDEVADYFLFDTKTSLYGGSGQKFDWSVIEKYRGPVPFFLSGGITADDAGSIAGLNHPKFFAVDLNSKFETEPALKDVSLLAGFFNQIRLGEKKKI